MVETYEVVVTQTAERDLEEILAYLVEHASYQTAERMQRALLDKIYGLSKMPMANGLAKELNYLEDNFYRRVIVKKSYQVLFEIEEATKLVYVHRILHVKRGAEYIKSALK